MGGLIVVKTGERTRLDAVLSFALDGVAHETASAGDALPKLKNRRVLFALAVGESGMDGELCALIAALRTHPDALDGAACAMIVDGACELYTKQIADTLALAANMAGAFFRAGRWSRRPDRSETGTCRRNGAAWSRRTHTAWPQGSSFRG